MGLVYNICKNWNVVLLIIVFLLALLLLISNMCAKDSVI